MPDYITFKTIGSWTLGILSLNITITYILRAFLPEPL